MSKSSYETLDETRRKMTMVMKVNNCDTTKYKCLLYDSDLTEGKDLKSLDVEAG